MSWVAISKINKISQIVVSAFQITWVAVYVQVFAQTSPFVNALQRPTCWSCLKPEKLFMKFM